jgi:hypothetical protein
VDSSTLERKINVNAYIACYSVMGEVRLGLGTGVYSLLDCRYLYNLQHSGIC